MHTTYYINMIFKRSAYTLTAYCYGSKSVTQPDASSKRYLWDKYRVTQIVHKTNRTDINSRTLQVAVIVIARFSQFKVSKKQKQKVFEI